MERDAEESISLDRLDSTIRDRKVDRILDLVCRKE
jgi:hypothetical protein